MAHSLLARADKSKASKADEEDDDDDERAATLTVVLDIKYIAVSLRNVVAAIVADRQTGAERKVECREEEETKVEKVAKLSREREREYVIPDKDDLHNDSQDLKRIENELKKAMRRPA